MSGVDHEKPPSNERLAAMPTAGVKGFSLRTLNGAPLKYATRPSALKATPGSLTICGLPPVQADSPGTKIRENERPPSREAITRSEAWPSWIHETRIRRASRGSTATEVSTATPGVKFGSPCAHGPENGLANEMRRGFSILTDAAKAGSTATTTKMRASARPRHTSN